MNITSVRVRKIDKESKIRGIASIIIDEGFAIHDIKIIEGSTGLFIAMPSRKNANGEYKDIAHPINSDTRNNIQDLILEEYNNINTDVNVDA